jgi:hypothetical protein
VAQLYPLALGSLFVASYDSQGYGGGILTRLHTCPMCLIKHRGIFMPLRVLFSVPCKTSSTHSSKRISY